MLTVFFYQKGLFSQAKHSYCLEIAILKLDCTFLTVCSTQDSKSHYALFG